MLSILQSASGCLRADFALRTSDSPLPERSRVLQAFNDYAKFCRHLLEASGATAQSANGDSAASVPIAIDRCLISFVSFARLLCCPTLFADDPPLPPDVIPAATHTPAPLSTPATTPASPVAVPTTPTVPSSSLSVKAPPATSTHEPVLPVVKAIEAPPPSPPPPHVPGASSATSSLASLKHSQPVSIASSASATAPASTASVTPTSSYTSEHLSPRRSPAPRHVNDGNLALAAPVRGSASEATTGPPTAPAAAPANNIPLPPPPLSTPSSSLRHPAAPQLQTSSSSGRSPGLPTSAAPSGPSTISSRSSNGSSNGNPSSFARANTPIARSPSNSQFQRSGLTSTPPVVAVRPAAARGQAKSLRQTAAGAGSSREGDPAGTLDGTGGDSSSTVTATAAAAAAVVAAATGRGVVTEKGGFRVSLGKRT